MPIIGLEEMATSTDSLFQPVSHEPDDAKAIASAIACIEAFTTCFNARDLAGMDACLHFPHIILSGERMLIWPKGGQMPSSFFDDLHRDTGWVETRYLRQEAVLVSPAKVHLVLEYTRNRADGSIISRHFNLWIVTCDGERWGIKQRSY